MKNTRFNRKLILSVIAAMLVVCALTGTGYGAGTA